MALTLYNLLKAALLIFNALAILHPHRFLKDCASTRPGRCIRPRRFAMLAANSPRPHSPAADGLDRVQESTSIKGQLSGMLHAVQYMRCACGRHRARSRLRRRTRTVTPSTPLPVPYLQGH